MKKSLFSSLVILLAFSSNSFLQASYNAADLVKIPVARLVKNLEVLVDAKPKDARLRFNLARVHGMAFASKVEAVQVQKDSFFGNTVQIDRGAWFGYVPPHVPFRLAKTGDPAKLKAAEAHLQFALQRYREVLKLAPKHFSANLGYGWCLQQAGRKEEAIAQYRKTIEVGWMKEKLLVLPYDELKKASEAFSKWVSVQESKIQELKTAYGQATTLAMQRKLMDEIERLQIGIRKRHRDISMFPLPDTSLGWPSVVIEAAGYLIPLLDPDKDRVELAKLQERILKLRHIRRPITPIAVPLSDGLEVADLTDLKARVPFDADGSGERGNWSWIRENAAWLVYDQKGNGQVTSGLQLFGSVTFWLFWNNGYEALATLDDNADGQLNGAELRHLALWRDANGNGISEPGELTSLSDAGIVALSCKRRSHASPDCKVFSPKGMTLRNGTIRPTYDLILYPRK